MSLSPEEQRAQQERKMMALRALVDIDEQIYDKENMPPNSGDSILQFDKQMIQQSTPKTRIDELKSKYEKEILDLKQQLSDIKILLPIKSEENNQTEFEYVKSGIKAMVNDIETLKTQNIEISNDKDELIKQLNQNENSLESRNKDLLEQLENCNCKINELTKNNTELVQKCADMTQTNTKLSRENDNFSKEIHDLKGSLDISKKENLDLNSSLEKSIAENSILREQILGMETENKQIIEKHSVEISKLTDTIILERTNLENYKCKLKNLAIFDVSIGNLITRSIDDNSIILSDLIRESYPDIISFKTLKDEDTIKTCLDSVEKLQEIKETLEQISHTIDDQESKKNLDISNILKKIGENEELLTTCNQTLMEENAQYKVSVKELETQLNCLKESSVKTSHEFKILTETYNNARLELNVLCNSEEVLKNRVLELEKENLKMQELSESLTNEASKNKELNMTVNDLVRKVEDIQGDTKNGLTYERLHSIDKTFQYEEYEVLQIKSLSLIHI